VTPRHLFHRQIQQNARAIGANHGLTRNLEIVWKEMSMLDHQMIGVRFNHLSEQLAAGVNHISANRDSRQ
jgi:hypothetical protein